MKILWLAPYPNIEKPNIHPAPWLTTLSKELVNSSDINLTVLDFDSDSKENVRQFSRDGINFIYLKGPNAKVDKLTFFIARITILKNFLKKNYKFYDLIHVHGTEHQYEQAIIDLKIPTVVSIQGIMTECVKIIRSPFSFIYFRWKLASIYEQYALPKIQNYICRTDFDKVFIKKINPNAKIYENWEIIRKDFFNVKLDICGEKILFVGGINKIKGIDLALKALDLLAVKKRFKIIILGYGNFSKVESLLKRHNLTRISKNQIEFRGFQNTESIISAYGECFCLLHPSYMDNSPNSICEAQIAGLPVIASNVGGVPNLIVDNKTGLLAELNVRKIADKILKLHDNKNLQRELASRSKAMARQRHNPKFITEKTIEIYKNIITQA